MGTHHGGVAERLGSGLQSRPHGFESRRHLTHRDGRRREARPQRAIGAAAARFPDTEEVTGSIPVSPTTSLLVTGGFFVFHIAFAKTSPMSKPLVLTGSP